MVQTETRTDTDALIPKHIANQILTAGPDHLNYRGGVGSVMNVYARHFSVYKCVTTHKPTPSKWSLISFFVGQYWRFIQTLQDDPSIRVVHLQGSFKGSFYRKLILFLTAKYGFGKQIIYHMHGSKFDVFYHNSDPISKRLIRWLVEKSDVVVCLSDYWHTFFSENFRTRRLEILGNVIHNRELDRETAFSRPTDGPLQLLFLGAIGDRKGIFDLLEVLRQHRQTLTGRLVLRVGGNGETERLLAFVREHQLEDLVRFEGWVSGEKKHELLSTSDVYILPSYHEGLPISILEAMNYQLPIIATPVGGTAEVVQDEINGFLVPPGDHDALANRLIRFVSQPDLAATMGRASHQLIQHYLPEAIFPKLRTLYESLLQNSIEQPELTPRTSHELEHVSR